MQTTMVQRLSTTLTGLTPNTGYEVQVQATNEEGTSAWSDSGSGMTTPIGICDRTVQVRDAILEAISGVSACGDVTAEHLAAIGILNLRSKGIKALKAGDFSGLTTLNQLFLSDNHLSTLDADIIANLTALEILQLSGNQLNTLDASIFSNLTELKALLLSGNHLGTLDAGIFSNLTVLKTLNLHNNRLDTLDAGIFANLTALEYLSLDNNHLSTLDAGIFSNLTALEHLSLYRNRLDTLDADIFSNLTALETLSLFNNRLSTLDAGIFSNLTALKRLNLRGNAVDPLPIILSLELIEEGQFKVRIHTGAPFNMALPILVANGTIGEENSIEISTGSVTSDVLTVSRTPDTLPAVTVDIGQLPALPPDNYGYALVKSENLPLEAIALINKAPTFTLNAPVIRAVDENTAGGQNIGAPISATDPNNHPLTYSLSGPDASSFTIVPSSGQLQTRDGVTYSYATKRVYSVAVDVNDGHGGTASIAVRIAVISPHISDTYRQFVRAKEMGTEPILPDFSYVGYHHFNRPVPDVTHTVFDVTTYGAIPDDDVSDQPAIQLAINAAEANGRGVVFFPPGEFLVNTDADTSAAGEYTTITIRSSNIVLRGSGSRAGGTVIRQVYGMSLNALKEDSDRQFPMFRFAGSGTRKMSTTTVTANAPRETFYITVADASQFRVGEWVELNLINSLGAVPDFMGGYTPNSGWEISKSGVRVRELHRIAEIQGNRIRFHEPLHANVKSQYDWKVHKYRPLEEVGVEDISLHGSWTGDFIHHKNYVHDYSYWLLHLQECVNSWVRRVSFINTSKCLSLVGSGISVYHMTIEGNQGHFAINGKMHHSWIGLSEDIAGPQHGPNVQGPRSGNVYYRYDYPKRLDFHAQKNGEPMATLFDRMNGGNLGGSSGKCSQGCPHHLRHFVAWNFRQGPESKHYDFWNRGSNQEGSVVIKPIIVGFHGNSAIFNENTVQILESNGSAVEPESLFDAQLELRLGTIPDWLNNLRTEWQSIRNTPLPNFLPPDRTPPTLERITLETEETNAGAYTGKLKLIYNEKLNPYTEVPSDAYSVSIQGVQGAITIEGVRPQKENYIANERNTVTIDLSWTGQAGATFTTQDVNVTYTPPHHSSDRDNKRVEDYGGIPAEALINYGPNRSPEAEGTIVAQTLIVGASAVTVDVSGNFFDPDGDVLTYTAISDNTTIATVSVAGSDVMITPVSAGSATITVTATDANGSNTSVDQRIAVTVEASRPTFDGQTIADQIYVLNSQITPLVLPTATGGNGVLTYTLSPETNGVPDLPAGLTFDATTHTISGTPLTAFVTTEFTCTATDADGKTAELTFTITVPEGICNRTSQVQTAILSNIRGVSDCALVTNANLASITEPLVLTNKGITTLQANDFSNLSNLQILRLNRNSLNTLPDSVFSDLSSLEILRLDRNDLSTLPAGIFSDLSSLTTLNLLDNDLSALPAGVFSNPSTSLEILRLDDNSLNTLPDSVFSDLSSPGPTKLTLTGNPGAPFTLTLQLKRTDNADVAGSATVKVAVAQGAPFDMTVGLSATGGTLSASNATISAGSIESDPITVTQTGTEQVTVSPGSAPDVPTDYRGISIAVGNPLVLFGTGNQAPVVVGTIPAQILTVGGDAVTVNVSNNFSDPDGDVLTYIATSDAETIATVSVSGSDVTITPVAAGDATVTVTATDATSNTSQTIAVTVTTAGTMTQSMYWVDRGTDKIQRADLDGSNIQDLVTRPTLTTPTDMALDIAGGKIYWMDDGTNNIQRANLDGSNVEELVTGLTTPSSMALDIAGGKIYWADRGTDKIQRANLDGTNVEDLVTAGLTQPVSMALDIAGGKMYWADRGIDKIQRANLDGTNVEDLVTAGLTQPVSIALDIAGGKMYWTDRGIDEIQRANLDGTNVEDLITAGLDVPSGIALDIAGGKMYWTDTGTDNIQRANLDGSNVEELVTGLTTPVSIILDF